jgi:DNA-binding LacI/PurR family transcriptional regulator
LVVVDPNYCLTVITRLARLGWNIPGDVSVISRDYDAFLSFVIPAPARLMSVREGERYSRPES